MKSRSGVLLSCATGALLLGLGPITSSALAADADLLPVKAPVVAPEAPWWTHGFIEFGGRGFLNDPPYGGHIWQGQGSLAKFYEYKTEKPGPFGDFNFATGSANGLYQFDAWGYNPGYSDQAYDGYFTKAGEHYLDFHWDQTPHVYSTSASTLFVTNGNALTLANPNLPGLLYNAGVVGYPSAGANLVTKGNALNTVINQNLLPTDIGIRRDTASVDYRYTPNDNWDIKANYSNMRRTGSQVDGVLFTATNSGSRVDVAKPIADTTQNFGVNGEYIGVTPWGTRFNAMAGYNGSVYTDDFNNYTVQNPFCFNPGGGAVTALNCTTLGAPAGPFAMMSTPPSNAMNAGTGTIGVDLPLNSRYMGTVTYSANTQNAQFNPFSINPTLNNAGTAFVNLVTGPATALSSLPAQSLNGQVNTLLVNNVLTTQWNPQLKTKVGYRYYNIDNQTPQLTIQDWALTDALAVSTNPTYTRYAPNHPLLTAYTKQDGVAEVTWRPVTSVNIGSAYNYERYDFTRYDASSTNENTGKVYADWKPEKWLTFRSSANYGERRASNYNYLGNVGNWQWFGTLPAVSNGSNYSQYYRQFFLDDRNRAQAKFQVDIDVLRNLTVTPNVTWRDDEFLLTQNQLGLTHDRGTAAGVEVAYAATPDLRFLFSYMNEQRNQFQWVSSTQLFPYSTTVPQPTAYTCAAAFNCQLYSSNIQDRVNTFIFGVNYAVIPTRLELGLTYTAAYAKNSSPLFLQNGNGPNLSNLAGSNIAGPQFPDVTTNYQRIDANAKYVIDPDFTRAHGIVGQVALKLRYAWERNSVANWNNDWMVPYMFPVLNQSQSVYQQWLAGNNPNYNVHLLAGTISWAW